ncbi:unnamed protein product [Microthlaspi erraticum]|nr:unnamed protein product [Microthlaspi erraticum]
MAILGNCSPHEVLFKEKPSYTMLRVFGSACYPYLRPLADHKLEPRSLQCVFIGYSAQHKGYRCLYPPTGKVYICRHVIFDEESFPFRTQYESLVPRYHSKLLKAWQSSVSTENVPASVNQEQIPRALPTLPREPEPVETEDTLGNIGSPAASEANSDQLENVVVENIHPMTTRAKAGIHKPNTRYVLLASKFVPATPRNIAEAMKHLGGTLQ